MLKSLLAVLLATVASLSLAQMPDLSPPKELSKLDFLKGEWTGEGQMTVGGSTMDFASSLSITVEGQFVKMVAKTDMGGMKMLESSYIGYEAKTSLYTMHTFTNFAPQARIETGRFEGDRFVTISEPWDVMGQAHVGRAAMWKISADEIGFKLEFKEGDKWVPSSETTFKRKK